MTELEGFLTEIEKCGIEIKYDQALSQFSTWKIGGKAKALLVPESAEQVAEIVRIAKQREQRLEILAFGSNVLFSDDGIEAGLLMRKLKNVQMKGTTVHAQAGVALGHLALLLAHKGWGDLAFASGIPGSLGGAVVMNAGCYGKEIGQYINKVLVADEQGRVLSLEKDECEFSYRLSRFAKEKLIVLEAELEVSEQEDAEKIAQTIDAYRQKRLSSQPYEWPNAGSVFKNPANDSAGRLIEGAGLKGLRIGDAQVSDKHANFIINLAQAKACDVIALMKEIRRSVEEKYGVLLQPEVKFCGFKANPLL